MYWTVSSAIGTQDVQNSIDEDLSILISYTTGHSDGLHFGFESQLLPEVGPHQDSCLTTRAPPARFGVI